MCVLWYHGKMCYPTTGGKDRFYSVLEQGVLHKGNILQYFKHVQRNPFANVQSSTTVH
jgi:hypothetical protein